MSARPGPSGGYHASNIPTGISPPELASQDTGRVTDNSDTGTALLIRPIFSEWPTTRTLGIAMSILPVVYESTTRQLTGRFRGRERNSHEGIALKSSFPHPNKLLRVRGRCRLEVLLC